MGALIRREEQRYSLVNPYIALVDILINFALLALLLLASQQASVAPSKEKKEGETVGTSSGEGVTYKREADIVYENLQSSLGGDCLERVENRNDPPGSLRLRFRQQIFSEKGELTPEGYRLLLRFAEELKKHEDKYRRIRIEGHAAPGDTKENRWSQWDISIKIASKAAEVLVTEAKIPPWFLTVSARGPQAPLGEYDDKKKRWREYDDKKKRWRDMDPKDPRHYRVEIVLEFAEKSATGEPTRQNQQ